MNWVLKGGLVLRNGGLEAADLHLSDSRIADAAPGARVMDVSRLWLLPGIVDVHSDTMMPRRPNLPAFAALDEADRQMLAKGINTAFHSLTISWEPRLRSLAAARAFVEALERARLGCDTRINLPRETSLDAMDEVVS